MIAEVEDFRALRRVARPSRLRGLAVTAWALTLGACATVGPDFKPPKGPAGAAAAGYAMAGDPAAPDLRLTAEARVAGPWWQAFGSPPLDWAIRQALADSPTLAQARATLEKAQAQARAVRGAQLPQVDAKADAQRERINTQSFGFTGFPSPTINLFSVGGTVSYDLDPFGGRRRATERGQADADAAARRADAAYLTLTGEVALQAMRIAGLRAQIAAVREIVASDRALIAMLQAAEALGGRPRSALSGGVAQLAEDEALLAPLQRGLDAARHRMALLAGRSPAEWTAPDFDLAGLTAPAATPLSLPSDLVRRRPDILAAEADLQAATAAVGVAIADQYPDVRLSASLLQGAIRPETLFGYSATGWNLMAGVTAPLFDGGRLKARRAAAEAEARAAMARYQETVLTAFVQVADVLSNLGADLQAIDFLTKVNAAAQAGARDAQTAYRLGGGARLDVVQGQRTLGRARRALVEAQSRRMSDLVELYAATAADWRPAAAPKS